MKLGMGFQIADDLLDVTASSNQIGKTAGKDAESLRQLAMELLKRNQSGFRYVDIKKALPGYCRQGLF